MKIETEGWERITEASATERFVCSYDGPFAQVLELNRPAVERFLNFASLDGRVLVLESKVQKPKASPDGINPDGSVTTRKHLLWGQPLETQEEKAIRYNPYFQVIPDKDGWKIALNGGMVGEDLKLQNKGVWRGTEEQAARSLNFYFRVGLKETLLKDKLTFAKDPVLLARTVGTGLVIYGYYQLLDKPDAWSFVLPGINLLGLYGANFKFREHCDQDMERLKMFPQLRFINIFQAGFNYHRRSVNSLIEGLSLSLELDRLALAWGYLDYQMIKGTPLIRAAAR